MRFKASLHFHTDDDPKDSISYSFKEAVDFLNQNNFEILALTCHQKVIYSKEYSEYAALKNILLIPGIEIKIEGGDVIILNADRESERLKSFNDLKDYKRQRPEVFVMAPHPFSPHPWLIHYRSLGRKLIENIDVFDGIEMTWFYSKIINPNKKAAEIAEKYNLPFISTTDAHFLDFVDRYYVEIEAEKKTSENVLDALRQKKFTNVSSPAKTFSQLFWPWLKAELRNKKSSFFYGRNLSP